MLKSQNLSVITPDKLNEAEIVLIRSQTKINADFLKKAPKLKAVFSATSGFDHIDWRLCKDKNITAAYAPSANAQSTAELTLALMLAWSRRLPQAVHSVKTFQWRKHLERGASLDKKTLGIIGLGRVGRKVAGMAQAFGMKIIAHDPYIDEDVFKKHNCERLGFIELLRVADYLTLHVPLTKETKHLINHPTLREMSANCVLINASRGQIVDESEVLVALEEGIIGGAALDVLEREPPVNDSRLLTHSKILLTPHIGAYTQEAWEMASQEAAGKAIAFAQGKTVNDTLPLDYLWFDKC